MNRTEYLLSCLAEECCEVGQRCTKALRFSLPEVQPGQKDNNAERLLHELMDLAGVVKMLHEEGLLPWNPFGPEAAAFHLAKAVKIEKFMQYSREQGALNDQHEK